eukprot:m.179304 g.179304  ORF g.179304 m.179304 type:complete len:934 (+) comp14731_c0_seq1:162-2963(+)
MREQRMRRARQRESLSRGHSALLCMSDMTGTRTLRVWAALASAVVVCHGAVLPEQSKLTLSQQFQRAEPASSSPAALSDTPPRASLGYRLWENRRCSDHYREVRPVGGATVESCLEICRAEEECAKTTMSANSSSTCYLFDAKSSCSTGAGWSTVFIDLRCGRVQSGHVLELGCPFGTIISDIEFASFGTPTGECSDFAVDEKCHASGTRDIVADLCIGENECRVAASTNLFGDPCVNATKELAVHVSCAVGPTFNEDTYFNAWSLRYWAAAEAEIKTRAEEWTSFMKALPDYPKDTFSGRGIVIVAGGKYLEPALVMIKMLRRLGCTLRIQVWHLGEHEMTAAHRVLLEPYSVETRNFEDFASPEALKPIEANVGLRLFQLKPLALLHSDLEEVLMLDSDNCPIRDPTYLFEDAEFQKVGTAFWPDFWKTSVQNPIWKIIGGFDIEAADSGWEQESGQLMFKKSVAWTAINLAVYLNSDFYMKLINGDKDTFRFSWLAAGIPFIMIETWPTSVGTLKELHTSDAGFCGHTMLQHDFDGQALFVHHNQLKSGLLPEGENFRYAKSPILASTAAKAAPVLGLQLPNRPVLSCLDVLGPEDANIDDPTCHVRDSGLEEFERMYFEAKKSIPTGAFPVSSPKKTSTASTTTLQEHDNEVASKRIRRDGNTTCTAGEFELVEPTVSNDRVCESTTVCGTDQTQQAPPTSSSDRVCSVTSAPGPTEIQVRVALKTAQHPLSGQGSDSTYELSRDGGQTYSVVAELALTRLHTYAFEMVNVPVDHPFILTQSSEGGSSASPYTMGVSGSGATGTSSLTVTPALSAPSLIYYQSQQQAYEGGRIIIVDPSYAAETSGHRFSTAYSAQAQLFELSAVGSFSGPERDQLRGTCEMSCDIRANCVGIFIYQAANEIVCYGLNDVSGDLHATTVPSISIRKVVV